MKKYFLTLLLISSFVLSPLSVYGASSLEISGWIPYWAAAKGTKDATKHIKDVDVLYPFAYTIKEDGSLNDMAGLKKSAWTKLFKAAKKERVEIIPSVMSSDGAALHRLLSNEELREEHIDHIVSAVKKGKFDGIDIDYEAKRAETREYFSIFLKDLKEALGSKTLVCTIESRTPPASLYATVPANIEYANDYTVIGKYCDVVQIMTYDQGRADIKLNESKSGKPYMPVSDIDWVRKVVELTVQSIPREKLMLGIPTYGYEYDVTVSPNRFQSYQKQWSLSVEYFEDNAKEYKVTPARDRAGELSYSYFPDDSPYKILSSLPVNASSADKAAAQALLYANMTGQTVNVRHVVVSDEGAIDAKIDLAREFNLRGVALFKIDGGEDQELWDHVK